MTCRRDERRFRPRPHGLPPLTKLYVWKVMKPALLHRVAAPSPSVLSFLRAQVNNAFERPLAQCTQANREQRGFVTSSRIGWCSGEICRANMQTVKRRNGSESRTFATSRCLLALDNSLAIGQPSKGIVPSVELATHRNFSTTRLNNSWNIFKSAKMRRLAQLQAPPPPPDETSPGSTGFGSSLGRIMRPTNELKMRCTELDEHGNVTLVSGEFKKSELIAKVRISAGRSSLGS